MVTERAGRRPTLEDVAARAGVSRAMASIVLREAPGASAATREKVLAAAAEIGYRVDVRARMLARQRSRLIGVVAELGDPFHAEVTDGLYAAAERHGYEVVLGAASPRREHRRVVDTLLENRVDALVLIAPDPATDASGTDLGERPGAPPRPPLAVVGRRSRIAGAHVVRTADDVGVAQAVDHLTASGHRRIVMVDGGDAPGAAARTAGYREAMRRHGLDPLVVPGGGGEEDGARAARLLHLDAQHAQDAQDAQDAVPGTGVAGPRPTAVVCYNDRCALGVLDVLIRAGVRVPQEISVVGFDDSRTARLAHIDLTSVAQDMERMAQLAVEALVAQLEGAEGGAAPASASAATEVVLPPRLVVRGSTGPAPAGG